MQPIPASERQDPRTLGAKCDECPLKGRIPCHSSGPQTAEIVVLGDYPSRHEEAFGKPFLGQPGRILRNMMSVNRVRSAYKTYAALCRPDEGTPARHIKKAVECCHPRLVAQLVQQECSHIIAFGEYAQYATIGKTNIRQWMGALHEATHQSLRRFQVVSTLDLESISRVEYAQWTPVVVGHFNALVQVRTGKSKSWNWPEYEINDEARILGILRRIRSDKLPIGFDVENIPDANIIMCLSLANQSCGVSVSWDPYGSHFGLQSSRIREAVLEILQDDSEKIMQNGTFDIGAMRTKGIEVRGFKWDTMLMHAIVMPPLPHTLNHIAAQYTIAERWKDDFKAHKDEKGLELFTQAEPEILRTYNAKDSLILPPLQQILLRELQVMHRGMEQYEALFERANIALCMKERGIPIDTSILETKKAELTAKVDEHHKKLTDLAKAVAEISAFNPDSSTQVRKLFIESLRAPILSYSEKSGKPKVDKKVLAQYLADENQMVTYAATEILEYRKWKKLQGFLLNDSLNGVPIVDGLCKTSWKTHGTRTGRWTSPLLILPKERKEKKADGTEVKIPGMRDLILGHHGNWFVEADYKSLELVVVAALAEDQGMLDIFARNGDIHTEVARDIFKTREPTKVQRAIVKTFNYGLVYGAADSTLWKTIRAAGVPVSLQEVARVRAMWFAARPKIKEYLDATLAKAKREDYIEAPISGRRYYFYNKVEPSKVYNNPVQMTAADLINRVFPAIYNDLRWPEEGILFQYHDAVIIDTPNPLRGWDILHTRMTQELTINGATAVFKVDIEIGKSWQSARSVTREEAKALAGSR